MLVNTLSTLNRCTSLQLAQYCIQHCNIIEEIYRRLSYYSVTMNELLNKNNTMQRREKRCHRNATYTNRISWNALVMEQ